MSSLMKKIKAKKIKKVTFSVKIDESVRRNLIDFCKSQNVKVDEVLRRTVISEKRKIKKLDALNKELR